ncbi:MAG: NADPH-dependent 7-cyano-7-deazaguanine reductase QueF [Woeseiaceae bacterium]|nr:NADPH-dependent 7-cyano-7-deazaguanine reductase QueF [Woeseiaceae bacterium]
MNDEPPLGRATDYPDQYDASLLHAIARSEARQTLGLRADLPFSGVDIWNAWELTWLDRGGKPVVATAEIRVPASSPNIVESKSLKLYLNSFAMTRHESWIEVTDAIGRDLSAVTGAEVGIRLSDTPAQYRANVARLPGTCLDELDVDCDTFEVDATLLCTVRGGLAREDYYTHLLRSLCPVTGQPDLGSVLVSYRGPRIEPASLLQYLVSFRRHQDFHEACVERMFTDVLERCRPDRLTVYARYQRRGGIDINPFRSNFESNPTNPRLWRQ